MSGSIPNNWVEVSEGDFWYLLGVINWFRDAWGDVEFYCEKHSDKKIAGTKGGKYYVNPERFR